jgi:hypothetical protein
VSHEELERAAHARRRFIAALLPASGVWPDRRHATVYQQGLVIAEAVPLEPL